MRRSQLPSTWGSSQRATGLIQQDQENSGCSSQPALKRLCSTSGYVSTPFQCPLSSSSSADGSRCKGSLGPRRMPSTVAFQNLSWLKINSPSPASTQQGAQQSAAADEGSKASVEPLVLFDPAEHPDDARLSALKRVVADTFLAEMLRPHQREGVKFIFECLSGLRKEGFTGGVLCDGMGLGKTFQCIASLWVLVTTGVEGKPTCRRPMIICPSSLVQNWGKELCKWLGDHRVEPVVVDDTKAKAVQQSLQNFRAPIRPGGKPRMLVMSYTTFRMHKEAVYRQADPDVVFCDEAHALKNSEAQITQAVAGVATKRRLLISGTPIQNDLGEFFAVFDTALPGLLGDASAFNKEYANPIAAARDSDASEAMVAKGMAAMNKLMETCGRFMIRRTSAVLQALLPAKVEQVVFCKMSPLQQRLYSHFLSSAPVRSTLAGTDEGGAAAQRAAGAPQLAPLAAITALKKLCCHPDLIYQMFCQASQAARASAFSTRPAARASAAAVSAITASMGKAAASTSGRQQLTGFEGCEPVFSDPSLYPAYSGGACQAHHSGKVMVLEQLLKHIREHEPKDKVVLVSNYTQALDLLQKMCRSRQWQYLRLDGSCSVKQRQALVDQFNDPQHPSFLFLVSSKAGGVGLNIIGANRLVLFDPDWNPANDLQAMARVWREGQKKRVWIYRMLTTGSIEEKVFQRQLAKQGLSEALVDDCGGDNRHFSRDDLRDLFRMDPTVPCDTHNAIKCSCDGSAAACQQRVEAAATAGTDGGADAAAGDITAWAHLRDASDSPDTMWGHMSSWIRERYLTFLFSDHTLNGKPPQQVPAGDVSGEEEEGEEGVGQGRVAGGSSVMDEDEEYGQQEEGGYDEGAAQEAALEELDYQ